MALKEDLAKIIDPAYFRRWSRLSIATAFLYLLPAVAAGAWLAVAHRKSDLRAFTSGPLSPAHLGIQDRCEACHDPASKWRPLRKLIGHEASVSKTFNQACLECHKSSIGFDETTKAAVHAGRPETFVACAACHVEHEGTPRLSVVADAQCASCHADLASHRTPGKPVRVGPKGERITSLATHDADFRALDAPDPARFGFNHAAHLEAPVRGPDGTPRQLSCADCHATRGVNASQGARDRQSAFMKPVRYVAHCASCHPLSIDERLAGDSQVPPGSVPHETPSLVRSWLRGALAAHATLTATNATTTRLGLVDPFVPEPTTPPGPTPSARLALVNPRARQAAKREIAPIDGYRPPADPAARLAWVASEVAAIESRLYAKNGTCVACHPTPQGATTLPLEPPPRTGMRERWLDHGWFDHAKHEQVECASCHKFKAADGKLEDVARSKLTADVLLAPGIQGCRSCHGQIPDDAHKGTPAPSRCTTCHVYHRPAGH